MGATRTDDEGHYELGLPPLGRYVLTALDPRTGIAESEDVVIRAQRRRFNVVLPDLAGRSGRAGELRLHRDPVRHRLDVRPRTTVRAAPGA